MIYQRLQKGHGVRIPFLFFEGIERDADGLRVRLVSEDQDRAGLIDGRRVVPFLQLDERELSLTQHLQVVGEIGKIDERAERLRGVVVLALSDLAQTVAGQHIGIVR